ncbi:MAG: hypothetical protein P9M00_08975 [Candidatus Tritonobacter lacicola]|nr:hypothetical protein [Candidatus Tritonobacter lacicola]
MLKGLSIICIILLPLAACGCRSSRPGEKGPVRKAVELPVAVTDKGLDKSYSVIEKKIRLPGGNKAQMLEQELPIYYEGGSNISGLQHD